MGARSVLQCQRDNDRQSRSRLTRSIQSQIAAIDGKSERLMDAYLDRTLALDEYRVSKGRLVEEKQQLKDELAAMEKKRGGWFEPAIRFVKTAKTTVFQRTRRMTKKSATFSKKSVRT